MSLDRAIQRLLPRIEGDLQELFAAHEPTVGAYYGMLRYHMGWVDLNLRPAEPRSGKRLRPLLCLIASEAAGGDSTTVLPAASALELVHNFSLVHDDIEDRSAMRRGRRAVWDIWGQAHGINAGDGLFVLSNTSLHRLDPYLVPVDRQLHAARAMDRACLLLCEGQFLDMTFEDSLEVDLDQYMTMIRRKTAALLAASAELGVLLTSDCQDLRTRAYAFGESLGIAFQIQDDILGIWGDERVTGKPAAIDVRDKKKTLPVVYALGQAEHRDAARTLMGLYSQAGPLSADGVQTALDILETVDARGFAEEMEDRYYADSLQNLRAAAFEGSSRLLLEELAASLVRRST